MTDRRKRWVGVDFPVWLVSYIGLLFLACASFFGFRNQSRVYLVVALVIIGAATALLTLISVVGAISGSLRYSGGVLGAALACQVLLGGALCLAAAVGVSIAMTNDPGKNNANVAQQLHRDPKYPLVGYWKHRCDAGFGLAIDKVGSGLYSVSFCGPGGCFRGGSYRRDTPIYGDRNYRVVDRDTLDVRNRSGFERYLRCE